MRPIRILAAALVLALLPTLLPTLASALEPRLDVRGSLDEQGFLLTVDSNLPDGLPLQFEVVMPTGASASATVDVAGGKASARFFTETRRFVAGGYGIKIATPTAAMMPDAVKAVIGARGEALDGPLIVEDEIFGRRLNAETEMPVGAVPQALARRPLEHERFQIYERRVEQLRAELDGLNQEFRSYIAAAEANPALGAAVLQEIGRLAAEADGIRTAALGLEPQVAEDVRVVVEDASINLASFADVRADIYRTIAQAGPVDVKDKLEQARRFKAHVDAALNKARRVMGSRQWHEVPD